jgi:hypothetical protein
MKNLLKGLLFSSVMVGAAGLAVGADQTWTGQISDSMCGASHAKMMEMHKDAKMTDRDCTLGCVKGGGKFVFVTNGNVYKIANQDLGALMEHAGHTVRLTGDLQGDTITVSKIVMPAKK